MDYGLLDILAEPLHRLDAFLGKEDVETNMRDRCNLLQLALSGQIIGPEARHPQVSEGFCITPWDYTLGK